MPPSVFLGMSGKNMEGLGDSPVGYRYSCIGRYRDGGGYSRHLFKGDIVFYKIKWLAQATLPIWYSFWLILPMTVWNLLKRKYTKFDILFLTWMASAYLPWIIWGIKDVQRFPFNYMFLYAIPALCLGIPYFWSRLAIPANLKKIGLFAHLVVTITFFLYYYPVGLVYK